MAKILGFPSKRTPSQQIVDLLKDEISQQTKSQDVFWSLLAASLIGTMLPFKIVVTFFSLTTVAIAVISGVMIWRKQLSFSKPASAVLVALLTTSILSGCAPAIFGNNNSSEIYSLIQQRDYKYHSMQKVGVFGLGLEELTIENAQFEADIETVYVAKLSEGYGIVSLSRITVAGE